MDKTLEKPLVEEQHTNAFVDKVTLEFLMNKNHFRRYVAKVDPERHLENQRHLDNIAKYRTPLLALFTDLLDEPEKQVSLDVNEAHEAFVKMAIRFFQTKEMDQDSNDILFDEDVLERGTKPTKKGGYLSYPTSSFWGRERVVKEY